MPFRRHEGDEQLIIATLEEFSKLQSSFEIILDGFDCFPPRVILIKVSNHPTVIALHEKFNEVLKSDLNFNNRILTQKLHPHMTIATRDLSEDAFEKSWPEYESKEFKASFKVESLFLLKHNGKHWDIYCEFPFDN